MGEEDVTVRQIYVFLAGFFGSVSGVALMANDSSEELNK